MKKSNLEATTLRAVMIVAFFMIVGLLVVGIYFGQNWISNLAAETSSNTSSEPATGNYGGLSLSQLQKEITNNQTAATKADSIIASNKDYTNRINQDLNKYASITGVSIENCDFNQSADTIKSLTPISGLQLNSAKLTLGNPVKFTNLIRFLELIESNIPKIQVTSIDINQAVNSNDSVIVKPLTIELYTK